jgi:hypothetical protein
MIETESLEQGTWNFVWKEIINIPLIVYQILFTHQQL